MSRTSPSYRAAPAAIYSNGRFVDGAADSPAIGCHFLLPHGSGAVRSRSNAIAASHTARARGHHFQALRAFLRFAIPERCTPTPWRRKRTMLRPYTTKRKETRGAPRSLGATAPQGHGRLSCHHGDTRRAQEPQRWLWIGCTRIHKDRPPTRMPTHTHIAETAPVAATAVTVTGTSRSAPPHG
ncbi:hypothetical protein BJV78DRAFT_1158965 [Lactifluus subvellereus]|nr:hypothetical protein BJV78DRAFT_1158965 [Lactifluus subvellereus]